MTMCNNTTIGNVSLTPGYDIHVTGLKNTVNTTDIEEGTYDSYGAMQFTVATVTVYAAMGVFCILINNIRKKPNRQKMAMQDEAVLKYLKQEKSLKLQGFHMQLKSLRDKYTVMVKQYEEKLKLIEIRKELESMDSGSPQFKRARHTRRLSLFNIHQGIKDKFGGKKRPSMDHALGKAGLSLLHISKSQQRAHSVQEEEEDEDKTNGSLSNISGIFSAREESLAKSVHSVGEIVDSVSEFVNNSGDTCFVDIENYKPSSRDTPEETDALLPPAASLLSVSV